MLANHGGRQIPGRGILGATPRWDGHGCLVALALRPWHGKRSQGRTTGISLGQVTGEPRGFFQDVSKRWTDATGRLRAHVSRGAAPVSTWSPSLPRAAYAACAGPA